MVGGDEDAARSVAHTITLCFPAAWVVAPSPLAATMEARARDWLIRRGVIVTPDDAEKFRLLAVGEYANWPFPHAPADRAEIITRFLSLWIFYDDVIEEQGEAALDALHAAIRGQACPPPPEESPHLRCWWELGQAYAQVMSPAWLERHAERFLGWVASVHEEQRAAQQARVSGQPPPAAAHLARRRLNIGMIPNVDFIEYQLGWELPEAVHGDPLLADLLDLSAEAVAIINDLFGVTKDQGLRWGNLVASLIAEGAPSPLHAFAQARDLLAERVAAMEAVGAQLLARHPTCPALDQWLLSLHHIVYGFAMWHSRAPRYRAHHTLPGGTVVLRVEPVPTA